MGPRLAARDATDQRLREAVTLGHSSTCLSRGNLFANRHDQRVSHRRPRMLLPSDHEIWAAPLPVPITRHGGRVPLEVGPALCRHIPSVVASIPEKEMIRTDAGRRVAPMQHTVRTGDWTTSRDDVGQPVGGDNPATAD